MTLLEVFLCNVSFIDTVGAAVRKCNFSQFVAAWDNNYTFLTLWCPARTVGILCKKVKVEAKKLTLKITRFADRVPSQSL